VRAAGLAYSAWWSFGLTNSRKADVLMLVTVALLLFAGCGFKVPVLPQPFCQSQDACNCWDYAHADNGEVYFEYKPCAPTPSPSVTPTPQPSTTPTPVPTPVPTPTPTPVPTPTPCVPQVVPFRCPAGTVNECWVCADRIAWEIGKGNWTPLAGTSLLYNDPGGNPQKREYLDRACNYVRRDGSIIRTAEQQFGIPCVDGNAICPASSVTPCSTPSPTPTPSTSPTPPTGTCPACPGITAIGTKVHQFQLNSQTVAARQEGNTWVAVGRANRVNLDATVMYGCSGARCDSEHDHCLIPCEDLRGPVYRIVSGSVRNCSSSNPGTNGRGFAYACDVTPPSEGSWEVCTFDPWISSETGRQVRGHACVVRHWRIP
jgi:hypothetical protein